MSSDSLVGMRESIVRAMSDFVEVESEDAVEVRTGHTLHNTHPGSLPLFPFPLYLPLSLSLFGHIYFFGSLPSSELD